MPIPILVNHDHQKQIGLLDFDDRHCIVRLFEPLSREDFFRVFGECSVQVLEFEQKGGALMIKTAEIREWSLSHG